jgi:hypothetical protein
MIDGIRAALVSLEQRMDRRFEALEDKIDRRFAVTDQRLDLLDARMSRQFIWVVGVQVTTFAALVAAILGAILVR